LKAQPGKDIVILGSGTIVSAFTQMGIIDEYRIFINPVILGDGKLHFTGHLDQKLLKLTDVRKFESGVVMLTYQPIL
jgi:dihydrofolate reductase